MDTVRNEGHSWPMLLHDVSYPENEFEVESVLSMTSSVHRFLGFVTDCCKDDPVREQSEA